MSGRVIKLLLDQKGRDVWSISPDDSVYDAVYVMAEKEVGALMVMEGDRLVGIISERDYARQIILKGRSSRDTPVREIMTSKVVSASPEHTTADCMAIMTERRVRHLPVLEGDKVIGVLSLGDLVKSIIAEQQSTIDDLNRYITQ